MIVIPHLMKHMGYIPTATPSVLKASLIVVKLEERISDHDIMNSPFFDFEKMTEDGKYLWHHRGYRLGLPFCL